eukprot:CAMPEP_0181240218 /NCGR_PEP_ID=MMETSP1096-20121128/40398_1 /TAXON_ID=156174 ORGANISM="Chrysochromulina ericina, Strain CCMP281" /NCGR_SAMPLE_ID=MMETSP1096 /ASSEMBLY_ACC=CAM_ASM_000453 /LENGTH=63 /DNA_ID=CAMNT_0023336063 /DNA_START=304 /DNA_END=495 /DNA_ORIENTATION=+
MTTCTNKLPEAELIVVSALAGTAGGTTTSGVVRTALLMMLSSPAQVLFHIESSASPPARRPGL